MFLIDEYDLNLSKHKLGYLVPILTDAEGHIIDGFHREKIDPNWPRVKIGHIVDPVQLAMARLAANVCRREVPAEEKTKLLTNIAELTSWDAKEIAEAIGMSYTWVMKYLPEDFKREYPKSTRRVDIQKNVNTDSGDATEESLTFESESITPTVPVEKIDTGFVFECPECERKYHLIHINPSGKHKFEEDRL